MIENFQFSGSFKFEYFKFGREGWSSLGSFFSFCTTLINFKFLSEFIIFCFAFFLRNNLNLKELVDILFKISYFVPYLRINILWRNSSSRKIFFSKKIFRLFLQSKKRRKDDDLIGELLNYIFWLFNFNVLKSD